MIKLNLKNKCKNIHKKIFDKIKLAEGKNKVNFYLLIIITFFCGVLLIISSYAWFYATLDVKIDFFKMTVSNHTGLFISLDGTDFSSSVEISRDSIINDLKEKYSTHNNQWPSVGLYALSSNGIKNSNTSKFDMYTGSGVGKIYDDAIDENYDACINSCDYRCQGIEEESEEIECFNSCINMCDEEKSFFGTKALLNTRLINATESGTSNIYLAFDFFLKNVSGSPKSDNLYLDKGTSIYYNNENYDGEDGIINSLRIGIVKIGSVPLKSDVKTIQNIQCNNNCQMIIYEPNSTIHAKGSIKRATKHNLVLVDGIKFPTYAVINEGDDLELANGQEGSGIELDTEHFALQQTIVDSDFEKPIFEIPNAITKFRAYVWIEGQDIDSLETQSKGGSMSLLVNFVKDLAGYY